MELFSINNILTTIWGYDVTLIELIAVVASFVAIVLAKRNNLWTFIIGLLSSSTYFAFFYQQHLYCMMVLQIIFVGIDFYGLINWIQPRQKQELPITKMKWKNFELLAIITTIAGIAIGFGMKALGQLYPEQLPLSSYPISDAVIMTANIVGQVLLAQRKIDNWYVWIMIDIFSVIIWSLMGMWLTTILYVTYLIISITAIHTWNKQLNEKQYA